MLRYFYFYIFCCCCSYAYPQAQKLTQKIDSIDYYKSLSKKSTYTNASKVKFAIKACKLSYDLKIDSIILESNTNLYFTYLEQNNLEKGLEVALKNKPLAKQLNDTISIADIYCEIGIAHHLNRKHLDSAYYYYMASAKLYKNKAYLYDYTISKLNAAKVLSATHNYFDSNKIYIGVAKELELLDNDDSNIDNLISCYKGLGNNFTELGFYDKSEEYLKKSLRINHKLLDSKIDLQPINSKLSGYDVNHVYINIDLTETFKYQKKYKEAILVYRGLLKKYGKQLLLQKDPSTYAAIKNNLAYNLFKSNTSNRDTISAYFVEAYKILYDLNASYEIASSRNDFSEFLLSIHQKDSAKALAVHSYHLSKNIKAFKEASRAMLTLSKIEEGEKGKAFLNEHIKLNDSLLQEERRNRNKFARIKFETDTYIANNKQLSRRNSVISIVAIVSIFILILLYIIRYQRSKNKTLKLEKAQQQASTEIYNLMLNEQHSVQEGRLRERYHIAEELHDGVLNALAGTRLGIEYLSSLDRVEASQYQLYIKELRKTELDIRDLSHALKHSKLDQDKGFVAILEEYVSQCNALQRFTCTTALDKDIPWQEISDMVKVNLFRCIQEALQNTAKHAQAQTVHITLALKDSTNVELTITDDGNGFDPNKTAKGIGLDNMKARANRLKGSFKIDATPHKGTTLHFVIPI